MDKYYIPMSSTRKLTDTSVSAVVSEVPADTNTNNTVQKDGQAKKEIKNKRVTQTIEPEYYINLQKPLNQNKPILKRKTPKSILKQSSENESSVRSYKKLGQNYAVNMCMCSQRRAKKLLNGEIDATEGKIYKKSKVIASPNCVKQTKPIYSNLLKSHPKTNRCSGVCFHKAPSNTSIDQLLETLVKWNKDHSSSEAEKDLCSLLAGSCPKEITKIPHEDEVNTNMQSVNAIDKKSSPSKHFIDQIEGSQSQSDGNKTSDVKKGPTNNNNLEKTLSKKFEGSRNDNNGKISPIKKRLSKNLSNDMNPIIAKSEGSKSAHPSLIEEAGVLPDNKTNITEPPLRETDNIALSESKYMGEINLDKSVEGPCKCSKCNNVTISAEMILPYSSKHKHSIKTMQDQSGDRGNEFSVKPDGPKQNLFDKLLEDEKMNADNVPIGDTKINADVSNEMDQDSKTKKSSGSYDIKFLGVTLSDVRSQKHENKNKQYIIGEKKVPVNNDKEITINKESKTKDPIIMTLETKEEAGDQGDTQTCIESPSSEFNLNPDYKVTIQTKKGKSNIYGKKCIERYQSQQTDEDKSLSVQNFGVYTKDEIQDTSCICCSKNSDVSKDLEENTFYLLEEHLKNKLREFKQTSCNDTCIPTEEEEKIFNTILNRVKKVISESTNNIACKCSKEEGTSKGSWNRAYGLLQEYLKTKIKRVQCSCVLAEENNDTLLPDVLDKVFHLIEYDFKRLQDICGCKMSLNPRDSRVCLKDEVPERDKDFLKEQNTLMNSDAPQNSPTVTNKNNTFDYEKNANNVLDLEAQQNLLSDKDSKLSNDDKLLLKSETKPSDEKKIFQKANLPYTGHDCVCTNLECSINGILDNNNETIKTVLRKPVHDTADNGKKTPILDTTHVQESTSYQVKLLNLNKETEPLVKIASKVDKIANTNMSNDTNTQFNSEIKMSTKSACCSCTATSLTFGGEFRPYSGYTIDCSCDAALGPCHCAKSVFRDKKNDMNNSFKNYEYEEKIYHEYDYKVKDGVTMDQNVFNKQSLSEIVDGDLFLHKILNNKSSKMKDRETEVSSHEEADSLVLKDSRIFFTVANNKTNTYDDVASLATDSSPQNWCDSHMHHGISQSDQLCQPYFIPEHFKNSIDAKNENTTSSSEFQEKCSCDTVPICHVKMLVENIENRLANANCTCDSMIPQVCPIHSRRKF